MDIASSSDIQLDYMKLLVTQLRNQNPLEPMDSNDMASQLAQFSQLQQLELANGNLSSINSNDLPLKKSIKILMQSKLRAFSIN